MFGSNSHASHAKPSVISAAPSKMSKLDLLAFSPIEPMTINTWLWLCKDKYLAWSAWNPASSWKSQARDFGETRIAMCSNSLPRGWSSRRASRIASYYLAGVSMPSRASTTSRKTSTISLKTARNTLSSAGDSCAISDSVFKNHQFFFANPVLQLRVRAIPNFRYENLTADALINAMATTWSSLIAEGFHDSRIQANAQNEKPRSHAARECPGDKRRNIPRRSPYPIAEDALPEGYHEVLITHTNSGVTYFSNPNAGTITVIFPPGIIIPSCVLEGDSDSDEDDVDD
ncbi:hypothetical protein BD769DRAFT_1779087 [Suillus cothurnatus]|nr:hypothetical protein BD769DRAFT_1779087 [Suillus cothurnatus]